MDAYRVVTDYSTLTGFGLPRGGMLKIEDGSGTLVRVEAGTLWITQDGDSRDLYLNGGDAFCLDRDGVALLQACGNAPLTMVSFEPGC